MEGQVKLRKVPKDLANGAEYDKKRQLVDAAKKKAVAQHVDYETFKNMVSVAHLRPLQAPQLNSQLNIAACWQFGPDGRPSTITNTFKTESILGASAPSGPASTSADFRREWRRSCPGPPEKLAYLKLCLPHLQDIFRVELPADLLEDVICVLERCWQPHDPPTTEPSSPVEHPAAAEATESKEELNGVAPSGRSGQSDAAESLKRREPGGGNGGQDGSETKDAKSLAPGSGGLSYGSGQSTGIEAHRAEGLSSAEDKSGCVECSSSEGEQVSEPGRTKCGGEPGSGTAEARMVLAILQALAGSGRFSLTVRLVGRRGKAAGAALFERLMATLGNSELVAETRQSYSV